MNRINLICLGVKDMTASLAFYKYLGFKTYEQGNNPPIVFFDNDGTKLELCPIKELAKDINADEPPAVQTSGFSGISLAINVHSIAEVDEIFNKVVKAGGVIAKKPEKIHYGMDILAILLIPMGTIGKLHMVKIGNLIKIIC